MATFTLSIRITNQEELTKFLLSDDLPLVGKLYISNVEIDNVDFLIKCTQLKDLTLCKLPGVTNVECLPDSLEELHIWTINIDNLDFLSQCTRLIRLTLIDLPKLTNVECLPDNLQGLLISIVNISNVNFLTNCVQLQHLILHDLPKLTDVNFLPNNLEILRIDNLKIDNAYFLSWCTRLTKLTMCNLPNLTNMQLPSRLEELLIDWTTVPISNILQQCQRLDAFKQITTTTWCKSLISGTNEYKFQIIFDDQFPYVLTTSY